MSRYFTDIEIIGMDRLELEMAAMKLSRELRKADAEKEMGENYIAYLEDQCLQRDDTIKAMTMKGNLADMPVVALPV